MSKPSNYTLCAVQTAEQLIRTGRGILHSMQPTPATAAGTITLRNGAAADGTGTKIQLLPIGVAVRNFGPNGIYFDKGLTVQCSVGADEPLIVWEAL